MKVSLRWIADYLAIDWKSIDVATLVEGFNTKVAEIEEYSRVTFSVESFFIAQYKVRDGEQVHVYIPEIKQNVLLFPRSDGIEDRWYLVKKYADDYQWATYVDFGLDQEGNVPAIACAQEAAQGAWKKSVEIEDYIFDIDNKSITHRPDLWGHYGLARECAVLLDIDMKKISISDCTMVQVDAHYEATSDFPFSLSLKTKQCSYFSALTVEGVHGALPVDFFTALRLMRIGQRPVNGIVDITNYVMFDCGQPLHAFDAQKITTQVLEPRQAHKDEKITLLDNKELALSVDDIVITDGKNPLALAGIKGGKDASITEHTTQLLVEAAIFDAAAIRLSSARYGIRTEASARFEKTLDPLQTIITLQRFLFLLKVLVPHVQGGMIVSLGNKPQPIVITIQHEFIEKRLGVTLDRKWVTRLLKKLGFTVEYGNAEYHLTVPSYRATKDVLQKEDIVEEVGRFYGYTAIPLVLPYVVNVQGSGYNQEREDFIKQFLCSVAHMHEVRNYAFFDNDFLKKINWDIDNPVLLANPLSAQKTTLVSSLIPGLLQNIDQNCASHDTLRFFEWARTWTLEKGASNSIESHVLAGIFYSRKSKIDFYEIKSYIEQLFLELDMCITWHKKDNVSQWASKHQTAQMICDGKVIGQLAKVKRFIMTSFDDADACVFEIDAQMLLTYKRLEKKFVNLPKYQASVFDISVLVPSAVTFEDLKHAVEAADNRIYLVELHDVFIKPEWLDRKSLTLRYYARDEQKTLQKKDLDEIQVSVKNIVKLHGAEVR